MARRRRYGPSASPAIVGEPLSPSESFVLSRLVGYALRLLSGYPRVLNKDFLEFVWFVLGPNLVREALEHFCPGERAQRRRDHSCDLNEIEEDSYDFAGSIWEWSREGGMAKTKLLPYFRKLLQKRERGLTTGPTSSVGSRFQDFARMFRLSSSEVTLCEFLFINESYEEAEKFFRELNLTQGRGRQVLACMLGISESELAKTLSGTLSKIGMLERNRYAEISLESDTFFAFLNETFSSDEFKNPWCREISRDTVPLEHHFLDPEVLGHILNLLKVRPEGSCTHVLISGPPGAGKTEFCLGLAKELGLPLREVKVGENSQPRERLAATWASINMYGKDGIILVDDADRLLNSTVFSPFFSEGIDKRSIHDLLEDSSGVRVLWVCNDVWFGASIIRRFAFSLRFSPFNREQRRRFWTNVLAKHGAEALMDERCLTRFVTMYEDASPAVVDSAVQKARATTSAPAIFRKAVALGIESHLELLTGRKFRHKDEIDMDDVSLDGLNLQGDNVSDIMQHLEAYSRRIGGAA